MPTRRRPTRAIATAFPLLAPQLLWAEWAARSTEMLVAASQVVAHRTDRMAKAGPLPSARDRREFTLMGAEKVAAVQESSAVVQKHLMTGLPWQLGMRWWQDAMAVSQAAVKLGTSRTPAQAIARAGTLTQVATAAGKRSARASASTARLASSALEPVAKRATANAKRLGRR
jgi:hypothetical protein